MGAKKYDKRLGIRTVGLREWGQQGPYNRYEATPYHALEQFIQFYRFRMDGRVVDFGCGRGRVMFFIHRHFQVPVVGIEAHDKTYEEAIDNKASYRLKSQHVSSPIRLKYGLAEHYEIKHNDNCFYFFNPFSGKIFSRVISNILKSVKGNPRTIEVILYYPLQDYKEVLELNSFRLINKIKVPGAEDRLEKFLVYRFSPILEEGA